MTQPMQELATRANEWPDRAHAITIDSPDSYSEAAQLLTGIKALLKEIEASCAPVVKAALAAHRAAVAQRKQLEAPLVEAESWIKRCMAIYIRAEQTRRTREHEQRLNEWLEQAKAERAAEVAALEAAGERELAGAVAASPLPPPRAVTEREAPTPGIAVRKTYHAEVTDLAILVRSVHEGRCPLKVLKPDMVVLNTFARAMGPTLNWPGVSVHEDVSISARAIDESEEPS